MGTRLETRYCFGTNFEEEGGRESRLTTTYFDGGCESEGDRPTRIRGSRASIALVLDGVEGGIEPEVEGVVNGFEGNPEDLDTGVVLHHDKGPGIPA